MTSDLNSVSKPFDHSPSQRQPSARSAGDLRLQVGVRAGLAGVPVGVRECADASGKAATNFFTGIVAAGLGRGFGEGITMGSFQNDVLEPCLPTRCQRQETTWPSPVQRERGWA